MAPAALSLDGPSSHVQQQRPETYALQDGKTSPNSFREITHSPSPSMDSEYAYMPEPRISWLSQILDRLKAMTGMRRRRKGFNPAQLHASRQLKLDTPLEQLHQLESWSSSIFRISLRCLIACPMIVLLLFGIVHIIQAGMGTGLFWEGDANAFLPKWGMQGQPGQYVARYPTDATRDVLPIQVHSHNDYWRRIPLYEALHYGCTGVEADVSLVDGDLFVGHNSASLTKNRTLLNMYINPLLELLDKQNPSTEFNTPSGRPHGVFDTDPGQTLALLIDIKTDGNDTLPVVESQLSALREKGYLTYYNGSSVRYGPITVVGTGNTPFELIVANSTYRDIFFDAPLDLLTSTSSPLTEGDGQGTTGLGNATAADFNPTTSFYASVQFSKAVGTAWRGHLNPKQMDIIRDQIRAAKAKGLKARFWDTPSWPVGLRNHIWHVLVKEGVDMLNADDLRSAARLDWRKWQHNWW